ncbi:hypothetical protein D1818_14115 [Aquimarina sp. BL5]|nr:hypothetical protein D1818_14115 [Aquimarina sp. BL5]
MKSFFSSFLKSLLAFSILLFSIHKLLDLFLIQSIEFYYPTWSVHLFFFITTLLIVLLVVYVKQDFPDKAGLVFLGGSFMKMMLSLFFLIPLIRNKEMFNLVNILVFFIPYFMYLAFETFIVLKVINKKGL